MICEIKGIPVYYEKYGEGIPILLIHGWSVDHRLMSGPFEPVLSQLQGYCRIYIDLPGMGKTPSADWLKNSDDMLVILKEFIDKVIAKENFLLAGESYGGYLSLGLINELGSRIDGVFLLCPSIDSYLNVIKSGNLPEKSLLWKSDLSAEPEDAAVVKAFLSMAVIATPETFDKYKRDILPGYKIHDKQFLLNHYKGEYNPQSEEALKKIFYDKPVCILTGRQDHVVGYYYAYEALDRFPRASFAILDCAGHNLQIENDPLFSQFVKDWILRVELEYKKLKG
ncbi:MAG: alpha/beta hydrolase [Treponema sp.]|nr:alpha/beta hydrolase [Treponema sp.]